MRALSCRSCPRPPAQLLIRQLHVGITSKRTTDEASQPAPLPITEANLGKVTKRQPATEALQSVCICLWSTTTSARRTTSSSSLQESQKIIGNCQNRSGPLSLLSHQQQPPDGIPKVSSTLEMLLLLLRAHLASTKQPCNNCQPSS